jgi:hypothetical protein
MREVVLVAAYRLQVAKTSPLRMSLFSGTAKPENKTRIFPDADEEGY